MMFRRKPSRIEEAVLYHSTEPRNFESLCNSMKKETPEDIYEAIQKLRKRGLIRTRTVRTVEYVIHKGNIKKAKRMCKCGSLMDSKGVCFGCFGDGYG